MILLKKLTLKSKLDFGKFENQSIERIFEIDEKYLVYLYYCYEKITFIDDVLDLLEIPLNLRIQKPGINLENKKEFFKRRIDDKVKNMSIDETNSFRLTRYHNRKKEEKVKLNIVLNKDKRRFSKNALKLINQGKTPLF